MTRFNTNGRPATIFYAVIWWMGAIGLLFLAQAKIEWFYFIVHSPFISRFFDPSILTNDSFTLTDIITPIRGIVFLCSFAILIYPVLKEINAARQKENQSNSWSTFIQIIAVLFILCLLFTPGNLDGLANEYSNSSLVFFTRSATLNYHQRYLMPILANILFFRGDFWFLIFSFLCAALLVLAVRLWFQNNQVPVSVWQLVSLGTASFIYFQISAPGYPDVLVGIFILIAFSYPLSTRAKLSLFTLSLATHEASLIIWFALAWTLFDKKGFLQLIILGGIYLLFWSLADHGILGIMGGRQSGGISNLGWVLLNPIAEISGILFSFKGLWALVAAALWYLVSQHSYKDAIKIILILAAGLLMTFLGVDTTRLFGWAFMAVLISWKVLATSTKNSWKRFIDSALFINLLIPPIYIQLNFLPSVRPGLYQVILDFLSRLLVGRL